MNLTGGAGIDVVIEASGNREAFPMALRSVRPGGRILLQGTLTESVCVNFSDYPMHKQVTILSTWGKGPRSETSPSPGRPLQQPVDGGNWSQKQNQELAIDLIARGELRVSDLPTLHFPFDEIGSVYASLTTRDSDYLHVVLDY